jgi:hypothetical protein
VVRTNLSTRPFYNERAVHAAAALVAILALAAAAFSVTRIVRLSRENTELATRTASEQGEAERLEREAAAVRRGIDQKELARVAEAAREANALIDHRTFSWTEFFNYIEATLPPDVRLVAVSPTVARGQTRVGMTVLARRTEDIDEFTEKLEASGAFENVIPAQTDRTENGLQRSFLESVYIGLGAEPEPAVAPPPGPGRPGTAGTNPVARELRERPAGAGTTEGGAR